MLRDGLFSTRTASVISAVSLLFALAACKSKDDVQEIDTTFDAKMASQAIDQSPFPLDRLKIHAVCGPASGKGLFGTDGYKEWQTDGITSGRLIFVSGSDNSGPNVIFRDVSGSYTSSLLDGAEVKFIPVDAVGSGGMWIVSYASTGITETHNLVLNNGRLLDLWTSNKPTSALGTPSAKIFTSNCVRP
jgi:hypothetical protein